MIMRHYYDDESIYFYSKILNMFVYWTMMKIDWFSSLLVYYFFSSFFVTVRMWNKELLKWKWQWCISVRDEDLTRYLLANIKTSFPSLYKNFFWYYNENIIFYVSIIKDIDHSKILFSSSLFKSLKIAIELCLYEM